MNAQTIESTQPPLISVDQLAELAQALGSALVVVDCRFALAEPDWGRSQYEIAHIPGAYYLDLNRDLAGPVQHHGGRHPLPDVDRLSQTLGRLGVGPQTLVVAYDDARFAFAARLWWLLRYLGHTRVAVLDGGWQAWQRAEQPTTNDIPPERSGSFVPQPDERRWVGIEQVKGRGAESLLIDARSPERYRGEVEPIDPIAGHIPGALNAFWQGVTDNQGLALSPERQRDRWRQVNPAILEEESEIMVYCGSGVTACVNLLALELAGVPQGKLYAGSWSDWCSYLV